jgi:hypothetical protein
MKMWKWLELRGLIIPFLGIHKWNFGCSVSCIYLVSDRLVAQRAVVTQCPAQLAVARPGGDPGALTHGGGGAPLSLPPADRLRVHLARDVVPLPVY